MGSGTGRDVDVLAAAFEGELERGGLARDALPGRALDAFDREFRLPAFGQELIEGLLTGGLPLVGTAAGHVAEIELSGVVGALDDVAAGADDELHPREEGLLEEERTARPFGDPQAVRPQLRDLDGGEVGLVIRVDEATLGEAAGLEDVDSWVERVDLYLQGSKDFGNGAGHLQSSSVVLDNAIVDATIAYLAAFVNGVGAAFI